MKLFYFCIMCLVSVMAMGATIKVPDDYSTIQAAIDASSNGDLILVEADTYTENIDFLGKEITVRSEDGPETTIIDGGQNHAVVDFNDENITRDSVIDGFTLTNGLGYGGGVVINAYYASPTIINNIIVENSTPYGAEGGGIYARDLTAPLIRNNIIANNVASGRGGGISISQGSVDAIIDNNIIYNNTAQNGGGIYIQFGLLTNNIIYDNSVSNNGGGIYLNDATLINNIIYNNSADDNGGGIYLGGGPSSITNCSIIDNSAYDGGGFYASSVFYSIVTNTIVWGNHATYNTQIRDGGVSSTFTYCDIEGGWSGTGNIDSDPLFVDESGGDFHLTYTSPCKDAGDNSSVTESYDFEGDPRISYTTVDMGADEFYTHLYLVDNMLYFIGVPDSSVSLYFGYTLLGTPSSTIYGVWYLDTPFYGPYSMGDIPASGVLTFEIDTDEMPPGSLYLQALIGSQLTNYCEFIIE